MNSQQKDVWSKPDFEEIAVSMECTAYVETL